VDRIHPVEKQSRDCRLERGNPQSGFGDIRRRGF